MKNRLRRLMVFRVGVEINAGDEVTELVGSHVDADVLCNRFDDLLTERLLALAASLLRDKKNPFGSAPTRGRM